MMNKENIRIWFVSLFFVAIFVPSYFAQESWCASRAKGNNVRCPDVSPNFDKHAIWLPGLVESPGDVASDDFVFIDGSGLLKTNDDGTLTLSGEVRSDNDLDKGFIVDINFSELVKLSELPGGVDENKPKFECNEDQDASDWLFSSTLEGTLAGTGDFEGAILDVTRIGPAFQVGVGANNKNFSFGASGWFEWTLRDGDDAGTEGDQPSNGQSTLRESSNDVPDELFPFTINQPDDPKRGDININLVPKGSIGDTVFCDINDDGIQDDDDPGIPAVAVNLLCRTPNGIEIKESTETDDDGKYLFSDIPDGSVCDVSVDPTTAPEDKELGVCRESFIGIDVMADEPFLDADFCFKFKPGSIGDTVFCDRNNDGVQDPEDTGIAGVTVTLLCTLPDGTRFSETQKTDPDGKYLFEDIPAGSVCTVTVDPTTAPDDKEPGDNCPVEIEGIDVIGNESFLEADFCFRFKPGSIGDTVFCDRNNDGIHQDDPDIEPGLEEVGVNLDCTAPDGTEFTDSTTTDDDGRYIFTDIPAGSVCAVTVDPSNIPDDKEPGDNCPKSFNDIKVEANKDFLDADFCFKFKPGSIGDTVFCDRNNNGTQDGDDPGIAGVNVKLDCTTADGKAFTDTMTTDGDGKYLFSNIPGGSVCDVTVDPDSAPKDKKPGDNCPKSFKDIKVVANEAFLDADFCFVKCKGKICGKVWYDPNCDGIRQNSWKPSPNCPVKVFNMKRHKVGSTVTDRHGNYCINDLPPGKYKVYIPFPRGYKASRRNIHSHINKYGIAKVTVNCDTPTTVDAGFCKKKKYYH